MMRWGILQRYVAKEVFRSFFLALTALTSILVLFVLVAQAAKNEKSGHHFAASSHLKRMLLDDPDNADLKTRLQKAESALKN